MEIAAFGKLLPSCTYCLCGSTVKYLVESLGSLLASRASSCEDEPNTGEDKVGLANILSVVTMSDNNDFLTVMASALLLPFKSHAVPLLVNFNLVTQREKNFE